MKPPQFIHAFLTLVLAFSTPLHAQGAVSRATFNPAGSEPIKPLWVLLDQALGDPATLNKLHCLPEGPKSTKSGDLVFALGGTDKEPGQGAALVNGKTGKLLWRTSFDDRPEGTTEWGRGCKAGPDGHIYQWSVTFHNAGNFKLERALFHLRKLDSSSGKILAHLKMAMDDPNSTEEPKGVAWQGSDQDIAVEFTAQHVLVATGRFLAEVDLSLSKILRSSLLPEKWRDADSTRINPNGAYAYWVGGKQYEKIFARPGEDPREVPAPKPGWKAVRVDPSDSGGHLIVVGLSPDKKSWAAGAYDASNNSWAWVKTVADLAKPIPGKSRNLAEISFDYDGNIPKTTSEKDEGKWIVDADTGDLRYRPVGYDDTTFLKDGKMWVIPCEYQVQNGRPNEALFVNSADGTVDAKLTLSAPFHRWESLMLPDGHILIAAVKDGAVNLEIISAKKQIVSPPRKIALELPSPPIRVQMLTYGVEDIAAAVIKVVCSDGKDYFCAIPLPSK